jgi:hypothetical protein
VSGRVAGATVTISVSEITHNRARGGHAEDGGTDGLGGGGGVHIAGGTMCLTNTQVRHNHAGTSQDNVLGDYLTIC